MKFFGNSKNKKNRHQSKNNQTEGFQDLLSEQQDELITQVDDTDVEYEYEYDQFDDGNEPAEEYFTQSPEDKEVEHLIVTYQQKKRKRRKIAFGVTCLLAIIIFVGYSAWVQPPEQSSEGVGIATPPLDKNMGIASSESPVDPEKMPSPTVDPNETRNKDAFTFVIAGTDVESGNTDTLMIGKFDTRNKKLDVVSIPRDTLANVGLDTEGSPQSTKKINTIFRDTGGVPNVEAKDGFLYGIRKILGFTVDCWAVINLEAFERLVDTIGGVDYDVPVDMIYEDYVQDLYINISKGMQHLDGKQALQVVRFRDYKNAVSPDLDRIGTQQDFIMTVAKQVLKVGNIPKIGEIAGIFEQYVKSDLNANHIAFFAQEFLKLTSDDITFHEMPHTKPENSYGTIRGISYLIIDLEPWLTLVNEHLNPYYQNVTENDVDILLWDDVTMTATSTQGDKYTLEQFSSNGNG